MLTKGTSDYKKAQNLANDIYAYATTDRNYGELRWDDNEDNLRQICEAVMNSTKGFASEVAKTVLGTIRAWGFGRYVAYCSSKQAWILACAIIENGIELTL